MDKILNDNKGQFVTAHVTGNSFGFVFLGTLRYSDTRKTWFVQGNRTWVYFNPDAVYKYSSVPNDTTQLYIDVP